MMKTHASALINIETLLDWQKKFDCVLLDASIPPIGTAPENIVKETIPGSLFFDIEKSFSDPDSGLPHTLIKPALFEQKVQALGINQNTRIILFDGYGVYSSPRAWWMFKIMGHENVFVLNGGLIAWKAAGYKTELTFAQPKNHGDFRANFQVDRVVTKEQIAAQLDNPRYKIFDARSAARFNGQVDEPRKGLRKGHIPGSFNIPFNECIESGYLKSNQALSSVVKNDSSMLHVFTCGSGITACIPLLAFYESGCKNLSLYDGSWAEWGAE
jgi:thiosulfate/3-mercaptopyruvate sulfurtransferase